MKPHELAGRRIEELRNLARLTGEEFGNAMGALGFPMSRQTVWKIEKGSRPLSLDELFAAAYVLGSSPFALLDPTPDELEIGDGVSLDAQEFGDWWLSLTHPDNEVTDSDMDTQRAAPLRAYFDGVRAVAEQNRMLSGLVSMVTDKIRSLDESEQAEIRDAIEVFEIDNKEQADA